MANCQKYNKGAMGHLMKHYERGKDENGEYVKFGNQKIDPSRTHLNYNLATHGQTQLDRIHERLGEVYCMKRRDVNVMCSWVVTVPKTVPEGHVSEFFERSYEFLEKKYGTENVISAYVHMDEETPHMHFAFVPVTYDVKKNREKVCAKDVITRERLQSFHLELQEVMDGFVSDHNHTFECNVLNGATDGGNRTILELKNEDAQVELEYLAFQRGEAEITLDELKDDIKQLKDEYLTAITDGIDALKDESMKLNLQIKEYESRLEQLTEDEVQLMQEFLSVPQNAQVFERWKERRIAEHRAEMQETKKGVQRSFKEIKESVEKLSALRKEANKIASEGQERPKPKYRERDE